MATKKPKVSIYLPPELKTELDKWAEEENRSVSNLVETVLKAAIANRPKKDKST
ncbi:ribbon-helix-helix protein, CopG family [Dolichospermum sp. ST_sed9]|nr:ribbon-helix-helix protein, CopG family [Dolichospermum sp. ST_sed9]